MDDRTEKRTTTTTTTTASSSSTRARAYAREDAERTLRNMALEHIRKNHQDILGRPMPAYTEARLIEDLEAGTPGIYYQYALQEAAGAPYPSWRYVMAIVARLKRQQVPEEDLLYWL